MIITDESHVDHSMTPYQRRYALAMIREGKARIVVGDPPILEARVTYATRGDRSNKSRLVNVPAKASRVVTAIVVGGTLATIYGGPLAPKETSDPTWKNTSAKRSGQSTRWRRALSMHIQFYNGSTVGFPKVKHAAAFASASCQATGKAFTLFMADVAVTFIPEAGIVAALDTLEGDVARAEGVSLKLMAALVRLCIDDEAPYDGIEELFEVFSVRFVP